VLPWQECASQALPIGAPNELGRYRDLQSLQKKSAGCCVEAKISQFRVLPSAERAYETCLSAGSIAGLGGRPPLERLKQYCSHSDLIREDAVFLVFGFVLAQLQGFSNLLLRQSLAKNQKSSRRIGYSIVLTALIL
jgi:hypothetical protein